MRSDGAHNVVAAYEDWSSGRCGVRTVRWDAVASSWRQIGDVLDSQDCHPPALALMSDGTPIVVWAEDSGRLGAPDRAGRVTNAYHLRMEVPNR